MTGKRQIPINNHEPPRSAAQGGGARPDAGRAGAPGAPAGAAAVRGAKAGHPGGAEDGRQADVQQGRTRAGKAFAGADAGTLQARLDLLDTDLGKLTLERDSLREERDSLLGERDNLVVERDGLSDSLLRLRAEFDNYRKRAARESFETRDRAQCDLLTDVLPVLDNLERALDAAEHHEESKVVDGVRMTRDMFVDLLARTGVEEISGVGSQFDPQVHEAVSVQPSEYEEGVVAAVLERGYRQGERVLRPGRVVVSAGPGGGGSQAGPGGRG